MIRTLVAACALAIFVLAPTASAKEPAEVWLTGLAFPTNMAWAPDGTLFFTEKESGDVRVVSPDGKLRESPFAHLDVQGDAERGLLGIALHPRFPDEPWVYVYFTDLESQRNHLVRFRAGGDEATQTQVLLNDLPQAPGYHNGGDLLFGPDGMLYVAVGESHDPARAQDPDDLGGKILRLAPDGSVPPDNPFGPANPVYSIGHRNSFGLCSSPGGEIYETENGPDVDDEINVLEAGGNYGWPEVTGSSGGAYIDPILVFPQPIAITGCASWRGDLVFGSYLESLVRVLVPGEAGSEPVAEVPGGITDLSVGPDGLLYAATSDAIWRLGAPEPGPSPSSAEPAPSPPAQTATATPTPAPGGGGGSAALLPVVAAVVLAAGLLVRSLAGRRIRRG
jgi:quinoprotein glucose dehydrogenase